SPHALDVGDELMLRELLHRLPPRAPMAAMIIENEAETERLGKGRERAHEPGRVGTGTAVAAKRGRPFPDGLGVEPSSLDLQGHAPVAHLRCIVQRGGPLTCPSSARIWAMDRCRCRSGWERSPRIVVA